MLEPESGVAYLAIKHNLPVVPAYVQGTGKFMPRGARCITPCAVRVYYGDPKVYHMEPGRNKDEIYKEVSRKIMDEIKALKAKYDAWYQCFGFFRFLFSLMLFWMNCMKKVLAISASTGILPAAPIQSIHPNYFATSCIVL